MPALLMSWRGVSQKRCWCGEGLGVAYDIQTTIPLLHRLSGRFDGDVGVEVDLQGFDVGGVDVVVGGG